MCAALLHSAENASGYLLRVETFVIIIEARGGAIFINLDYVVNNRREMLELGARLGRLCRGGERFYFIGELGAGKTTFVKGLGAGLGVEDVIISPSFVLLQVYRGRLPFFHLDLYRLTSPAQLNALDLDDIWEAGGVVAVEWADLFLPWLESGCLEVDISYDRNNIMDESSMPGRPENYSTGESGGACARRVAFKAADPFHERLLEELHYADPGL